MRAVAIDEDRGVYSFPLGGSPTREIEDLAELGEIVFSEPLLGWGAWLTAVHTEDGWFFVDQAASTR